MEKLASEISQRYIGQKRHFDCLVPTINSLPIICARKTISQKEITVSLQDIALCDFVIGDCFLLTSLSSADEVAGHSPVNQLPIDKTCKAPV